MSHFPTVETCAAVAFALRPFFAFCFFRNWTPPEKGEEEKQHPLQNDEGEPLHHYS